MRHVNETQECDGCTVFTLGNWRSSVGCADIKCVLHVGLSLTVDGGEGVKGSNNYFSVQVIRDVAVPLSDIISDALGECFGWEIPYEMIMAISDKLKELAND